VVVGTLRALKMHGGVAKEDLSKSDPEAVKRGFANMHTHLRHMRDNFSGHVPVFAALNQFPTDTAEEISVFAELCREAGFPFDLITSHRDGNQGAVSLAKRVAETLDHTIREEGDFVSYDLKNGIRENIRTIARKFYEANKVEFSPEAEKQIDRLIRMGCNHLPVCIAKTPYALNDGSEDPDLIHIREVLLSAGAGFVVVKTGEIMTMPGLPRNALAAVIDLKDGKITGMM
jgi:formate--tetrahydrofolate ligase